MKTALSFILSIFLLLSAGAQTTDYITSKDFQVEKKKLNDGINAAKKPGMEAKKILTIQDQKIDSLAAAIRLYQSQLAASNDSVAKLTSKVSDLRERVYQRKTSLRTGLVVAFVVVILLWILLLIWVYMIKKKSDQNFLSLKDEIDRQNIKIDQGLNKIETEIKASKEMIQASSDNLNRQLQTGLGQFEARAGQIEQQIRDNDQALENKIRQSEEKDEIKHTQQDNKINDLISRSDARNQELIALINSLEKDQKGIEPGFIEKVNTLKAHLEQKIQSVSAEISKLRK